MNRGAQVAEPTLGLRTLYILPTRHGLLLVFVLAVILLAGVNYGNGLAYGLAFLLAGIGLVAMIHTHRNAHGLRLAAGGAKPVFAGETAVFAVRLHNETGMQRIAIGLRSGGARREIDVPEGGVATVELPSEASRRGYMPQPPLELETHFPLGLWRVWSRRLVLPHRCLIYPKPAPAGFSPARRPNPTGDDCGHSPEGDDFAGLRDFRPGDPPQHVAWKSVARGRGWHTKQFAAGGGLPVWLDWNALAGLDDELRLSILCRWVLEAEERGENYGLRLPDSETTPGTGPLHRDRCLERLALYGSAT